MPTAAPLLSPRPPPFPPLTAGKRRPGRRRRAAGTRSGAARAVRRARARPRRRASPASPRAAAARGSPGWRLRCGCGYGGVGGGVVSVSVFLWLLASSVLSWLALLSQKARRLAARPGQTQRAASSAGEANLQLNCPQTASGLALDCRLSTRARTRACTHKRTRSVAHCGRRE